MTDFSLASVLSSVIFIVPLSLLPVLPLFFSVSNYFLFSFCLYFLLSIHSCPYYHLCSARLLPAIHLFLLSILLYPYLLLLSCPYISQLLQAILYIAILSVILLLFIPLISRVFGPSCKLRAKFFSIDLWPKREARGP